MAESVRWDNWELIQDAVQSTGDDLLLVVVCFAQKWSPTSLDTAVKVENIRKSGEADRNGAQAFIINADEERGRCWEFGIKTTPAFVFYWKGKQLSVQRLLHDNDVKLTGSFSEQTLLKVIKAARESSLRGVKHFTAPVS
ncbi:hypothetical protein HOP50_05g39120 [Chloropicon primus]|uniref:Thioredoxin domain-containing protein n=1 Tax=Chloropicon primus TaxID=1764295 RepID=A0A5B8MQ11_9CHLO|nr:hypothetical protein A3770_05p39000 [Chloropicon primus]UPR00597.1 hypothetical protein HOP50_05g39120 [Chloropicon primus]|eukprot:QDZ21382.1 hypothetical protein A3770_05p39000 [Chloropicon primus]